MSFVKIYCEIITVDKARDSVDFALMRLLSREDIVVTQDFGLAAMVLGKGASALNQNGLFIPKTILKSFCLKGIWGKRPARRFKDKGAVKKNKEGR
jgi:uncharacterized protein YaiI (UPF0178 family)